jgi:bacillithiol system protein YtxJ
MDWLKLKEEKEIDTIKTLSTVKPVIIFKHSTRCSISTSALGRLERNWKTTEMEGIKPYYLDLLAYRPISLKIESEFHVQHESPQVLVIKNGECIYHASHIAIQYNDIKAHIN